MYVLGIDPGIKGAMAVVGCEDTRELCWCAPLPLRRIIVDGKERKRIDPEMMFHLVMSLKEVYCDMIGYVEAVGYRQGDGGLGAFSFGYSAGIIDAVLACAGVVTFKVYPHVWKRQADLLKTEKVESLVAITHMYPYYDFKSVTRNQESLIGIADAAHIARFGLMTGEKRKDESFESTIKPRIKKGLKN